MSYADLRPWFPSASHPALPAASSILATLRHLTGPGKGNELKPEERAALIGVSALLGCEKVQNKDLVERTAQKASSVAPAHFRSALRRARILLAEAESQAEQSDSTPRRRSARGESSASASALTSGSSSAQISPIKPSQHAPAALSSAGTEIDALSPFSTPKKKFKYSSGVDLSGLIRHSPSKGSPLKQSLTPGKAGTRVPERQRHVGGERAEGRAALAEEVEGADEGMDVDVDVAEDGHAGGHKAGAQASEGVTDEDGEDDPMGDKQTATPTKVRSARFTGSSVAGSHPQSAAAAAAPSAATFTSISRRARAEDLSAFLALRPGATPAAHAQQPSSAQRAATEDRNGAHMGFEEALRLRHGRGRPGAGLVKRHQVRGKRDRTGKELRWDVQEVQRRHEGVLKRLEGLFERYERSQRAA